MVEASKGGLDRANSTEKANLVDGGSRLCWRSNLNTQASKRGAWAHVSREEGKPTHLGSLANLGHHNFIFQDPHDN